MFLNTTSQKYELHEIMERLVKRSLVIWKWKEDVTSDSNSQSPECHKGAEAPQLSQ